ncbi:MAG: DNA mismatch repair endonuclease MutL [Lachnospiraceae bacterium]|nr:DNA mismatch repair endonuclease MutL [Lachnospiraceae bacterium]
MPLIHVLDEATIDKIAAGEVVERPANIVKELVENAIDAGATSVTVEIKQGGITFIRVTDNGSGIRKEDIRTAFLRHATSKISGVEDLDRILSLGFRGEALSSIAAVSQVELITRSEKDLMGYKYVIEGSVEKDFLEVGVPVGTTMIVRNIFFNVPARRKFLKTATTEGNLIADICEHLAMARPDISFRFINGGQMRFQTSGRRDLKEVIYNIYGRDIASQLVPIHKEDDGLVLEGYLGKPLINRSSRNFENYYINGRFVRNNTVSLAVEEGYREYLMQHKFPFTVLHLSIDPEKTDINVHPSKMDVRFDDQQKICDFISSAISSTLKVNEMIPETLLNKSEDETSATPLPEPFELKRMAEIQDSVHNSVADKKDHMDQVSLVTGNTENLSPLQRIIGETLAAKNLTPTNETSNVIKSEKTVMVREPVQMNLFDDKILSRDSFADYKVIGQVFKTFWIIEYKEKLILMDQHAAHEKVKYERLLKKMKDNTVDVQLLAPPIVLTLTGRESTIVREYESAFEAIGFRLEDFGGNEVALRGIPMELYGRDPEELFKDILDELLEGQIRAVPEVIKDKIASMACKSAVKGNNNMSEQELVALLQDLFTLENPYNCPHGRPTVIIMSKYELEKRFKRIV